MKVKVDDEILAIVTGLLAEGEIFPIKSNPEEARTEFADEDGKFVAERQGTLRTYLNTFWADVSNYIIKYSTFEGRYSWLNTIHF